MVVVDLKDLDVGPPVGKKLMGVNTSVVIMIDTVADMKAMRVWVEPDSRNTVSNSASVSTGSQVNDATPTTDILAFRSDIKGEVPFTINSRDDACHFIFDKFKATSGWRCYSDSLDKGFGGRVPWAGYENFSPV